MLRDWLVNTAEISDKRIDDVLQKLDDADVDTMKDLRLFSRLPDVFDTTFTPLTAAKIRSALEASSEGI